MGRVQRLCELRASCVAVDGSSGRLDCPGKRLGPRRRLGKIDERETT